MTITLKWNGDRTEPGLLIQADCTTTNPAFVEPVVWASVKSTLMGMNRKSLSAALIRLLLELDFKAAAREYEGIEQRS